MFPEELGIKFKDYVESIRNDGYSLMKKEKIVDELVVKIENAVNSRTDGFVGIAFSGGLDSSIIAIAASKLNKNFMLLSVGFNDSDDIRFAVKIAREYGMPLKIKTIDDDEAERIVKDVAMILGSDDVVSVGVGCVVYSVLEAAKEQGINVVLGGLGAEEIFAGYERHRKKCDEGHEEVHKECWRGLENLYGQDLWRDERIARHFGIRLLAPFLDDELIRYAMGIDPRLKVNKEKGKIILQDAAMSIGLRKEYALRRKKAAQYGSDFDKAMKRLAKKNGFKHKKDYLGCLIKNRL